MKNTKLWIGIIVLIIAGSAVWSIILLNKKTPEYVRITQDGKLLYTLDLSKEHDRTIEIEYQGRKNIIEIKDGRIHMKDAECPDHICVDTGWLENDVPIVCLPNRLVIEHTEKQTDGAAR